MIRWTWWGSWSVSELHGGGQHFRRRVLVPGSGKRVSRCDPFDDPPLRGRRPVACREAFRQIDGLAGPADGKQAAEADLPDGKVLNRTSCPGVDLRAWTR
jgi:hypothetical protein